MFADFFFSLNKILTKLSKPKHNKQQTLFGVTGYF